MQEYLNKIKNDGYSQNTLYTYKSILTKITEYANGVLSLRKIKLFFISVAKDYSAKTQELYKRVIISYCTFTKCKWVDEIKNIKVKKERSKLRYIITLDEFKSTLNKVNNKLEQDLFDTLFFTGVRISELKTIGKINHDFIKISGKGNVDRIIPITTSVRDVCFESVSQLNKRQVYKIIRKHFPEEVTAHTFRRSFCTNLVKAGANLKIVSEIMGHATIETTARYMHFSNNDHMNELSKFF